jgi:hypothetical protein
MPDDEGSPPEASASEAPTAPPEKPAEPPGGVPAAESTAPEPSGGGAAAESTTLEPPPETRATRRLGFSFYRQVPHPHIAARRKAGPVKIADQLPKATGFDRFNAWLAVKITAGVGTMWCAYAFAALAFVSLPSAIRSGSPVVLVSWISQTFLQLVLLSIIIVGQNIQAGAADRRAEQTYLDAEAVLHETLQIQEHLATQDQALEKLIVLVKKEVTA